VNIALIGYGKMGRQIEEAASQKGHWVVAVIDPFANERSTGKGLPISRSFESAETLAKADVALEFTRPATAVGNIIGLSKLRVPAVVGTTGWYDKLGEVRQAVEADGSSLLYASNFSLGVNLFYRMAAYAAKLADAFPEYDVAGYEIHHNKKADSPSGTAKTLAERVLAQMTRKKRVVWDTLDDRPPAADELHFPSLRVGSIPGTHALVFDSATDSIEIRHTARSRAGFVSGAILAAEWLVAQNGKRQGVFTIDDVLEDL
jgi:4-hydroxy-tetrahydrodipicolinate reductase